METAFGPVNDSVKSAERVLTLLEALGAAARPLGLAELSQDLGIPKSSMLALLRTLTQRGYAERTEADRYVLASPFGQYEGDWLGGFQRRLVIAAQPEIARLVDTTRETVNLGVVGRGMLGRQGVVRRVFQISSPQEVRYEPSADECPAYCTAMGRMLMAHLPEDEVETYLSTGAFPKLTRVTETRPAVLRRLVKDARLRGFAEIDGEFAEGGSGAAAPVFNHAGGIAAALNLATLTDRWHRHRADFIPALVAAADAITQRLGGRAPKVGG
jgi:DNA-binding IclR family transcriptional regulator